MMRKIFFIVFITLYSGLSFSQNNPLLAKDSVRQQRWVDSTYATLNLDQKIGQLFMIRAYSNKDTVHTNRVKLLVKEKHVGGIIFSKGGPVGQAKLNNKLQLLAKTPLLVAMDAEWGLNMRLDSTYAFPWNMTLGAVTDNELIKKVGQRVGAHCKRLGVHVNFGPVVDINTNPKNPIIGNRSFGEDRTNVTEKSLAFMLGMQSEGVLANAKHFPGHGDTDSDSHKTLPTISFDKKRLDSLELYPYKKLVAEGLGSVMVAHLNVPNLTSKASFPSSLSKKIVTDLLKTELQFNGLIFTDALEMKGIADYSTTGRTDLDAFMAGSDVLLISEDITKGIATLKEAYITEVLTEARLSYSVKKILSTKYKVGLNKYVPVVEEYLVDDLNSLADDLLYSEVIENALTLVKNHKNLIPIKNLENKKIAYLKLGDADAMPFIETLRKYANVTQVKAFDIESLKKQLAGFNQVIIGLHRGNDNPWKPYKFTDRELVWVNEISRTHDVILTVFAKPYALLDLENVTHIESVLLSYQNSTIAQEKSAQLIFGALASKGKLPVSAHKEFPVNTMIRSHNLLRLGYGIPESVGLSTECLDMIDEVVEEAIDTIVFPGAQILVARKGKVIYNRSFGSKTYAGKEKITSDNIYDLASLTKILATLPMMMKLEESRMVNFKSRFKDMLPELKGKEIEDVSMLDAMSHYGRMPAWIPFYIKTLDKNGQPSAKYYRRNLTKKYSLKVDNNLFLRNDFKDSIYLRIDTTKLKKRKVYRYSDLTYYLLKRFVERKYKMPLDKITQEEFYKSLGATHTTFNPLEKFNKDQIVPSEKDDYFRHKVVQGYVHDMGAAMLGGVGGHAGLFSNANDVAKIMQMYLQKGFYGGKRYLNASTVDKFNTCHFCHKGVRRGVGFDKPIMNRMGNTCGCVSDKSFGHSGFTGTFTWVDPEQELVYVFLSNRTFPTAANRKIITRSTRTVIQQLIYDAILPDKS